MTEHQVPFRQKLRWNNYLHDFTSYDGVDPSKTHQHGVWGVARLSLADPLTLILGARVSWYGYWNTRGVQTMEENGVVSPSLWLHRL